MSEATVADRRLHPATLFIGFIRRVPEFVLGLPAFIGFASDASMRRILLIALAGAAVSFLASLLGWLRFRYGVGASDIVIESGVLNRQRRIIPFDRIQDVEIEQPLLARLFGTARVRVETGGAAKNEGNLDAVSLTEAHRLRDLVRKGGHAPAAGEAPQTATEEPLLFEMPLGRLFLAGLFNFSLFYLAVIAGAFQYLEPLFERNLIEPKSWNLPTREQAQAAGIYLTLLLLALLLLLGVVTGVIRTVAQDYRFRLTRAPNGFRRLRGLFTLSEVVIPLRRVQLALLQTGWLRRRWGWFALQFQTLSADAQATGHQSAAPFARMEELRPILAEAGLDQLPSDDAYIRVSRLTVLRRCLSDILPLAIAAVAAAFFWRPALLFLIPLTLALVVIALGWRRHRYLVGDNILYVAEGLFRQRLWILPFGRLQTVTVSRSPLQRRFGLATVSIDTAGASLFSAPAIRDVETPAAEALAAHLLAEYQRARSDARAAGGPSQRPMIWS